MNNYEDIEHPACIALCVTSASGRSQLIASKTLDASNINGGHWEDEVKDMLTRNTKARLCTARANLWAAGSFVSYRRVTREALR